MALVSENDPRLLGHPVGTLRLRKNRSHTALFGWQVSFRAVKSLPVEARKEFWFRLQDFNNDVDFARQAAVTKQLEYSHALGKNKNTCRIVNEAGDIEMDLNQGYKITLDAQSFERIYRYVWWVDVHTPTIAYPSTKINGKAILMHRFLLSPLPNQIVDHIDGDTTNYRHSNLRLTTYRGNSSNRVVTSKSGIPGVAAGYSRSKSGIVVTSVVVSWYEAAGKPCHKNFTFQRHGSPIAAVEAAIAWRFEMEEKYDIQSARRMRANTILPTTNDVLQRLLLPYSPRVKRTASVDNDISERPYKKIRLEDQREKQ